MENFISGIWKKYRTLFFLVLAMLLFSLASPVIKLLVQQGGRYGLRYPHAISFCNVLFVGNMAAGILVGVVFGYDQTIKPLQQINRRTLWLLWGSSLIAVIYPALIFASLEITTVTNVVLLSRFEVLMFVLLSYLIYGVTISRNQGIGYLLIGLGVAVLTFINDGFMFNTADVLILLAGAFFALASIFNRAILKRIPVATFLFFRNLISAIAFFIIGLYLFGWEHFSHAFQGELWGLMLVYAGIIIVFGQFLWFRFLPKAMFSWVVWLLILSPFFTLFFAFILLRERPSLYETIAMAVILLGMVISNRDHSKMKSRLANMESALVGG